VTTNDPTVADPLPSFDNPPVIEVVCGVTYEPIEGLLAPHFGLLWKEYQPDYPEFKEVDLLLPVIESFVHEERGGLGTNLPIRMPLLPRIWFISRDGTAVIQVQRDRFLHNWRKVSPSDSYPRYGNVITKFQKCLSTFQTFISAHKLGGLKSTQFEMCYINHIPQGSGWNSLDEIGKILPDFQWRSGNRFLTTPEGTNWRTTFVLPGQIGRLHATIQTAVRRSDNKPLLTLDLTVRGIGKDSSAEGMVSWFDTARKWIVNGFADLTGTEVQEKIWKRTV